MEHSRPTGAAPDSDTPTSEPSANAPAPSSPVTPAGPIDSGLDQLVRRAKADLAARRGVVADAIEVVEARSLTWPDPSLGCPQPGMLYKQVPVDGVLIRLSVDGVIFSYHGGGSRAPFLCEHPAGATPAPPRLDQ